MPFSYERRSLLLTVKALDDEIELFRQLLAFEPRGPQKRKNIKKNRQLLKKAEFARKLILGELEKLS